MPIAEERPCPTMDWLQVYRPRVPELLVSIGKQGTPGDQCTGRPALLAGQRSALPQVRLPIDKHCPTEDARLPWRRCLAAGPPLTPTAPAASPPERRPPTSAASRPWPDPLGRLSARRAARRGRRLTSIHPTLSAHLKRYQGKEEAIRPPPFSTLVSPAPYPGAKNT